jgi:HSP20 family protein
MIWSDFGRFSRTWDPWLELDRMQRLFRDLSMPATGEFPAVNVWVNGDAAEVKVELPGVDPKDVDISVVGKTLTLRGSRSPEEAKEEESYHRRERWSGSFNRAVDLPFSVNAAKVEARFSKGILTITLPRAEEDKPRKIAVISA